MKFANVRELKNKTSEILRKSEKDSIVITSKGKPRALIIGITEDDFSDFILEQSQQLLESLDEAWKEYLKKGGVTIEDYLAARKKKSGQI